MMKDTKPNAGSQPLLEECVEFQSAMQKAGFAASTQKIYLRAINKFAKRLDREKFAVNLKKTLPRLPLPDSPKLFWAYSKAGAELAELHLNYERLPPHPEVKEDSPKPNPSTRVQKMRFAKEGKEENKTAIIYNDDITLWNIPLEAYDYIVNGKSAIEWIMERYQVRTHKESGIVNDPNLWCDEHDNPRYIIDLLKSIVTLSLETMKIVNALPELAL
jgi:predicted helicase